MTFFQERGRAGCYIYQGGWKTFFQGAVKSTSCEVCWRKYPPGSADMATGPLVEGPGGHLSKGLVELAAGRLVDGLAARSIVEGDLGYFSQGLAQGT